MRLMPLLLLIACLSATLAAAATSHKFKLEDLRLVGCKIEGERAVLDRCFDQGQTPHLAMEAEDALDLIANPAAGQADAACSGQKCIVRVDRALFPINVTRPGRYQRWVRGYFPQGGGWLHSESLDFSKPEWFTDCDGLTAGRWVWVKGPTYDLSAGMHLLWLHNWHGGALLDKVVLLPEGSPEPTELGPSATPLVPARQGWIVTSAVTAPGLTKLSDGQWPMQERGGKAALSVSLDGGRAFKPFNAETLAQPIANPLAQIVLRADLRAAPDGASPALGTPTITYETDPRTFVTIENDRVKATVLRPTGALIGLYDKLAQVECLTGGGVGAPFALRHLPPGTGKPQAIPDEQVRLADLSAQKTSLAMKYTVADGIAVLLTVSLTAGELNWSIKIDNKANLDIVEVVSPRLPGLRMGERSADDLLMVPNWQGGVETVDPVKAGGDGLRYPTGGAMCWFDLYERQPDHGVYLSGHDQSLLGCALQAEADRDADALTFSLTKYARIRWGDSWTAPPVVLGVHQGDWHKAADAYRTWAQTWMRRPNPPEWVREADGWFGLVVSADGSRTPFRQVPDYLKHARELGTNYIQVWGQMTGGSNCDSLPYPNPVLGTLDEFKEAAAEVRRWGGHITFYVSSQFWKVDYGDEPMIGSTPRSLLPAGVPTWQWDEWINWALRGYDGGFSGDTELTDAQRTRYQTRWLRTIMCPFTEAWSKRHLKYWCVDQYGKDYGASGIYLDETCAAGERVCFAANHGHPHHGIWGSSLARTMQDMVESGRKFDPDWSFAMEGCGDAIGQFADVNLISPASAKKPGQWGANRRFAPECFHYTFPDYLLYDGVANGMYGKSQEDCFLDVHLHGNRYDSFGVYPAAPYLKLRQRTKQLLYRARFMDTVGIESSDPAVRAKVNVLMEAGNEARLVNIANPETKQGAAITMPVYAGNEVGFYFDLEGHEGIVEVKPTGNGGLRFIAPTSRASTVVVATRCEPLVRVPTTTVAAGDRGTIEVQLTNVTPEAVSGELRLDKTIPGVSDAPVRVQLPAQTTTTVALPVVAAAAAERRCHSGHVILKTKTATVRRPMELLVVSPFAVSAAVDPQGVRVTVHNQSQVVQQAALTVSGPLWDKPTVQALKIEAGGDASVLLPLNAPVTDSIALQAEIKSGKQIDRQSLVVRPLVLNGGFETTGAGGRPGAWSYQSDELASSTTEAPHSGERCLKLTGRPGAFLEADQFIPVATGQSYEALCHMRRTAGEGARVQPSIVLFVKTGPERYAYMEKVTQDPDDQWNEYRTKFTVSDDVSRVAIYLYNVNSAATVWFDDVRVDPMP